MKTNIKIFICTLLFLNFSCDKYFAGKKKFSTEEMKNNTNANYFKDFDWINGKGIGEVPFNQIGKLKRCARIIQDDSGRFIKAELKVKPFIKILERNSLGFYETNIFDSNDRKYYEIYDYYLHYYKTDTLLIIMSSHGVKNYDEVGTKNIMVCYKQNKNIIIEQIHTDSKNSNEFIFKNINSIFSKSPQSREFRIFEIDENSLTVKLGAIPYDEGNKTPYQIGISKEDEKYIYRTYQFTIDRNCPYLSVIEYASLYL